MKVVTATVSSADLLYAHKQLRGFIERDPILPILANFQWVIDPERNVLHIKAANIKEQALMEVTVEEVKMNEPKSIGFCVPAKVYKLLLYLEYQPIMLEYSDNNNLSIITSNGKYNFETEPDAEFIKIPDIEEKKGTIEIDSEVLKTVLKTVLPFVCKDDLRPVMCNILVRADESGTRFVATDGHRLICVKRLDLVSSEVFEFLLRYSTASYLMKNLPSNKKKSVAMKVLFTGDYVVFVNDKLGIISRVENERFPDYQNVLGREANDRLVFDKKELSSAIKRTILFSNTYTKQVVFSISKKEVVLSTYKNSDSATEVLPSATWTDGYNLDTRKIGFNGVYLLEVIKVLKDNTFEMKIAEKDNQGIIFNPTVQVENQEMEVLLMPVMISFNGDSN